MSRIRILWGSEKELKKKKFKRYKALIFNKNKNYYFWVWHKSPKPIEGRTVKLDSVYLINKEDRRSFGEIIKKQIKWSSIQAKNFLNYKKVEGWNMNKEIIKNFEKYRKKRLKFFPIFLIISPFRSFFNKRKDGKSIKSALAGFVYSFNFYFSIIINIWRKYL